MIQSVKEKRHNRTSVFSSISITNALEKVKQDADEALKNSKFASTRNNDQNKKIKEDDPLMNVHPSSSSSIVNGVNEELPKTYPLKFCSSELAWGSIELNKTANKFIEITNLSSKQLNLKTEIIGSAFNLENHYITLESSKSVVINVNFSPKQIGLFEGAINFILMRDVNSIEKKWSIGLCGYGGHSKLILKNIHIAPSGNLFLMLGELKDLTESIVKYFSVTNFGSLDGFVIISLNSSRNNFQKLFECVTIEPSRAIVPVGGTVNFKLILKPTRNHMKHLFSDIPRVMRIANLKIILGDEPNRFRIRYIIENSNQIESSLLNSELLKSCCNKINGERVFNELAISKESLETAIFLSSSVKITNISLIVNCSLDDTINNLIFVEGDETIMYRSVLSDNYNSDHYQYSEAWSVKPNRIHINCSNQNFSSKVLTIQSYMNGQHYTITSNFMHLFNIVPSEGDLAINEHIDIKLSMARYGFLPEQEITITITIKNENIVVPIHIV